MEWLISFDVFERHSPVMSNNNMVDDAEWRSTVNNNQTDYRMAEVGAPGTVITPNLQLDSAASMATMMMEMPAMRPATTVSVEQMSLVPMLVAEVNADSPVNSTEDLAGMEASARLVLQTDPLTPESLETLPARAYNELTRNIKKALTF